jgi:tRNA pseudouridine13 synthase
MDEMDKGNVLFKNKPEDFIVEEVHNDYICKVSENISLLINAKVDLGKLDIKDRRDFLMCDLEKVNMDHFTALSILTKELNNLPHEISYAGTKDKMAWTCQRISIFNADINRIKNFSNPNIILKNFKWIKHRIKIGDLKGNRFKIVLRDVDKNAIKVLHRLRNSEYIPNLFGSQRFGSLRKENVIIGKLILRKKFKEAIFAYLTSFGEQEREEVKKAKKKLKLEKSLIKAQKYFPVELKTENLILQHLSKNENDWIGALNLIGDKAILIMCQSVQSKLFNDIVQRLIENNFSIKDLKINILGYNSQFSTGSIGDIEREVLEENGLELEDFYNSEIPFLSLKSSVRNASFQVDDLTVQTEDDEIFPLSKKIILSFTLDSGVYATTFLDQFFDFR